MFDDLGKIPDFLVVASLFSVFSALFFLFIWFQNINMPGVGYWAMTLVCQTIGVTLYPFRGILPNFLTYPVAELFILSTLIFASLGNRRFFNNPVSPSFKILLSCILIYMIAYLWALYFAQDIYINVAVRTMGHCVCWTILCLPVIRLFVCQFRKNDWGLGLSFYSATMAVLTGLGVGYPLLVVYDQSYFSGMNNMIVLFSACLSSFPMALAFSLLCFERKELTLKNLQARTLSEVSEKNRMLSWLSHEVRTPINAMVGHARILADLYESKQQVQHHCGVIQQAGIMLGEQVNHMLAQQKSEAVPHSVYSNAHLGQFVKDLSTLMQPLAESKGLALKCDLSESLQDVYSMPDKDIRLVLTNLLSNAIKFSQQGSVVLSINVVDKKTADIDIIEFSVTDTGSGISPKQQKSIFKPFFHINHQDVSEGAGLGLAICQSTLKKLGSELTLDSVPGKGSHFAFKLPLTPAEIEATEHQNLPSIPGLSVLLVEDIAVNREVISYYLVQQQHKVEQAATGGEALSLLTQHHYDLILLDIHLPDMEAEQLIKQVSQQRDLVTPDKIVVITADSSEATVNQYQQLGVRWWLSKPVDPAQLQSCLYFAHHGDVDNQPEVEPVVTEELDRRGFKWLSESVTREQLKQLMVDTPKDLHDMLIAVKNCMLLQDHEALKKALHRIASSSATLAMAELSKVADGYCDNVTEFQFDSLERLVERSLKAFLVECHQVLAQP